MGVVSFGPKKDSLEPRIFQSGSDPQRPLPPETLPIISELQSISLCCRDPGIGITKLSKESTHISWIFLSIAPFQVEQK